jgi:serine/threonine-protein kinase
MLGLDRDPLLGRTIKNALRVLRAIAQGGMGRVYEGEQLMGTATRKVAIKTLRPDLSQDLQIVARFNRE